MQFTVLIPARLASTRLPNKPLADICGAPMVVRVAQRARLSQADKVVVATDSQEVMDACASFGIACVMTGANHISGSDRLAQACTLLGLPDDAVVVNVQGDEPLIDVALIDDVAQLLVDRPDCVMGTAAHAIESIEDFLSPNIVKVVLDARLAALYFSRSPIPYSRDHAGQAWWSLPEHAPKPLRHVGIYSYRAAFLKTFPHLKTSATEQLESLEQLRVLWHGHKIAVHITQRASCLGVDTPADLLLARELYAKQQQSA